MEYKGFTYTPTPKTAWDNLSMLEKSEMMKVAVKNGITDLKTIREKYNEFAEGGDTKQPVTTSGAGYVPNYDLIEGTKKAVYNYLTGNLPVEEVRSRLYENISPIGYTDAVHRFIEAVRKNKPDEFVLDDISSGKADERGYSLSRDALWAEYLQIPKNKRHSGFRDSKYVGLQNGKYKPSLSKENINYKALVLPQYMIDGVVKEGSVLPLNTNIVTPAHKKTALGSSLGRYTVGRGYDEKGDYVSYYDKWDLSPFGSAGTKDASMGIGMPVEVYDRIYLDDYYGVKEPTHATYLPEVTIYGNKHKEGGSIHIAPSKRGTFTAAATKHGKSVQAFASQVLAHPENYSPSMRRKANFARNAAKWHGLGGNLFLTGGATDDNDPATKDWEHRREHPEVKPTYKRTKKDEEYWKAKQERNDRAAEKLNRHKDTVMSALSNIADSTPFTGSALNEAAEAQRQEKVDKMHELKLGFDATMTAAEWLAAGYGVARGLTHLNRYMARQATQSTGQAISRDAMRNLTKWNRRVAQVDKPQVLMNGIGSTADAYQWLTADNSFDAWENGLETGADAAGVIGGMNWFRDLPYLRRIGGNKIDAVLDGLGYGAASWDVVKNIPPLSTALESIREESR